MDDLGFNKIAGAILATGLGMLVLMKLPGLVMADEDSNVIAYKVGAIAVEAGDGEEIDLPFPQPDWVAAMDEARGAKVFKKCTSCHNAEDGGANGTGPNLWKVVGADKASHAGYDFSAALKGLPGEWTYENLNGYLTKPSAYAPGTKMNFIGLKKAEDRAAVIEYLRLAAPTPLPRPEPVLVNADTLDAELTTPLETPSVQTEQSMEQPTIDPSEQDGNQVEEPVDEKEPVDDTVPVETPDNVPEE